jgi:branched-chain amino acid aminotransferase
MDKLPRFAHLNGRLIPYGEAKVGLLTQALHYGTACFGGLRGYWSEEEEELFLFRPMDHYRRFLNSAKLLRMDLGTGPEELAAHTLKLLAAEGLREDCYIRPLAFKAEEGIGVHLRGPDSLGITAFPFSRFIEKPGGAHVTISSWTRVGDSMIPPRGKIAGSYVNSALMRSDAQAAGFDDAIALDHLGQVAEASVANLFMLRNGVVATPLTTGSNLEGITRLTILALLANELGQPVVERPIDRTELYLADELWFSGTGVEILPVTRIDHRPVGDGRVGPLVERLRALFQEVVRGRMPRHRSWLIPVYRGTFTSPCQPAGQSSHSPADTSPLSHSTS